MDILKSRTNIIKLNNKLFLLENSISKEDEKTLEEITSFISSNLINNLHSIIENNIHINEITLPLITNKLTNEEKYNILKSLKIRTILSKKEVKSIWNQLNENEKKEYFLSQSIINNRDHYLLLELLNNNILDIKDIEDKITKNSLKLDIPKNSNIDDYMFICTKEKITNFINKTKFTKKSFTPIINEILLNNLEENSVILLDTKENIISLIEEYPLLLNKINFKTIKDIYSLEKIKNIYKETHYINLLEAISFLDKDDYKKKLTIEINKVNNNTLNIYPEDIFSNDTFTKNPRLLLKYKKYIILKIINSLFEDEVIEILRNKEFIEEIDKTTLEIILSTQSLKTIFNFLQNESIYNKIENITFNITNQENTLIEGFIDSLKLTKKINANMYYKLIQKLPTSKILEYLNKPYIINNLTEEQLLNIVLINNIKINQLTITPSNTFIINYINSMWEINFDPSLITPKIILDIFNMKITNKELEEVNYLFTTIKNKENLTLNFSKITLLSYKAVILAYKSFGIQKTLEILFESTSFLTFTKVISKQKEYINNSIINIFNNELIFYKNIINNTFKIIENYPEKYNLILNNYLDINDALSKYNITKNNDTLIKELTYKKEEKIKELTYKYQKEFIYKNKKILDLKNNKYYLEKNKENLKYIKYNIILNYFLDNKNIKPFLTNPATIKNINKLNTEENIELIKNLINNKTIKDYLESKKIYSPDNYDKYIKYLETHNLLIELNLIFEKLSYIHSNDKLSKLAIDINSNNILKNKDLIKAKELIDKIDIEITYNTKEHKFIPNNLINSYSDIDSENYYKKVIEINKLILNINKTINLINNQKISTTYYDLIKTNIDPNIKNYKLKDYLFNINDLEKLFNEDTILKNNIDIDEYPFIFTETASKNSNNIITYTNINKDEIYKRIFKNQTKFIYNINYKNIISINDDLMYDKLINLKLPNINNYLELLGKENITFFAIIERNNYINYFYTKLEGNKLIISKPILNNNINKYILLLSQYLIQNPYIDIILSEKDFENNYYLDNYAVLEQEKVTEDYIYYGPAISTLDNKIFINNIINNSLLDKIKYSFILNNQDETILNNWTELQFDNCNSIVISNETIENKFNQNEK